MGQFICSTCSNTFTELYRLYIRMKRILAIAGCVVYAWSSSSEELSSEYLLHIDRTIGEAIVADSAPSRFPYEFKLCLIKDEGQSKLKQMVSDFTQFLYENRLLDITIDIVKEISKCDSSSKIYLLELDSYNDWVGVLSSNINGLYVHRGWKQGGPSIELGRYASANIIRPYGVRPADKAKDWLAFIHVQEFPDDRTPSEFYLKGVLQQELFQALTFSLDFEQTIKPRSLAQEYNFDADGDEIEIFSDEFWDVNPKNICLYDVMTMNFLYSPEDGFTGKSYSEFIEHIKNNYDEVYRKSSRMYNEAHKLALIEENC